MRKFDKQLKSLPRYIRLRCLKIMEDLAAGKGLQNIGAKVLERSKDNLRRHSIPLTKNYRLVVVRLDGAMRAEWVGTHQNYDKWIMR